MTDALGNLVRFVLLPGQRYDTVGVAPLIQDIGFGALIADKAFDSNWIIDNLNERGASIIISQRPHRLKPLVPSHPIRIVALQASKIQLITRDTASTLHTRP